MKSLNSLSLDLSNPTWVKYLVAGQHDRLVTEALLDATQAEWEYILSILPQGWKTVFGILLVSGRDYRQAEQTVKALNQRLNPLEMSDQAITEILSLLPTTQWEKFQPSADASLDLLTRSESDVLRLDALVATLHYGHTDFWRNTRMDSYEPIRACGYALHPQWELDPSDSAYHWVLALHGKCLDQLDYSKPGVTAARHCFECDFPINAVQRLFDVLPYNYLKYLYADQLASFVASRFRGLHGPQYAIHRKG